MTLPDQELAVSRVLHAIDAIRRGEMVIMVDEEDRENEGDLVFAAEHVTPEKINFMAREARGLICLALETSIIDRLKLPMMQDVTKSSNARETAFTVSIEAKHGITTGISAHDRAQTIRVAVDKNSQPDDIMVPGHIFPLRGRDGGVLARAGHTEGSIDLAKLAGCSGAAVICEVMKEDGSMARMPDLEEFAAKHSLPIVTIPDLIQYRLMQDSLVEVEAHSIAMTKYGSFDAYIFRSKQDGLRHYAFTKGDNFAENTVDVRVHVQRAIADVFDASGRIERGFKMLEESSHGVLIYLSRQQKSDELSAEFSALFTTPTETKVDASALDQRLVGLGAQILRALSVKKMRVLSTSTRSYIGLSGFGLEVTEHIHL